MVFSQTSHKTQSVLKVVEIDRLKAHKITQPSQPSSSNEVVIDEKLAHPATPPPISFSEIYLKPEPLFDGTMYHETDCEFFQDLVQWCSTPAKEEQVQTIDPPKPIEERKPHTDTIHTPFSPQGWEVLDANSPAVQAGFYNNTPKVLSPNMDNVVFDSKFMYPTLGNNERQFEEQFLDLDRLPVVIGLASTPPETNPWKTANVEWPAITHTDFTKHQTQTFNTIPFIDQDDSLDLKMVSVIPREVERNDVVISEYVINNETGDGVLETIGETTAGGGMGLSVDVLARPSWSGDVINTPDVLSYVEQLEKEKIPNSKSREWIEQTELITADTHIIQTPPPEYEPITPKSESHPSSDDDVKLSKRRRHDSEDSDETYTPYTEQSPRKYKRRKPNFPIKDMIKALEGSQQLTKARRGRPPKRRESTVSSVCSFDETSSNHEHRYRELRDKNNEASKRSRMNRKLKELQMEQLVEELEEKNKRLQVRADILEEMTKKLKDALMAAMLQNK